MQAAGGVHVVISVSCCIVEIIIFFFSSFTTLLNEHGYSTALPCLHVRRRKLALFFFFSLIDCSLRRCERSFDESRMKILLPSVDNVAELLYTPPSLKTLASFALCASVPAEQLNKLLASVPADIRAHIEHMKVTE